MIPRLTLHRLDIAIATLKLAQDDPEDDRQTALIDLLADLMHLANREDDLNFQTALAMAEIHFREEEDE